MMSGLSSGRLPDDEPLDDGDDDGLTSVCLTGSGIMSVWSAIEALAMIKMSSRHVRCDVVGGVNGVGAVMNAGGGVMV